MKLRLSGERSLLALGILLSLSLHLVLFIYFLNRDEEFGAVQIQTAAISVNLQTTEILEAAQQGIEKQAASVPVMPVNEMGQEDQAELLPQEVEEKREAETRETERLARETKRLTREAEALEAERQVKERETERKRRIEERRKRAAERERKRAKARPAVSGSRGEKVSRGRVSASKGAIRNYAGIINAHIARNKPRGQNARGRVVISFSISASGRLTSASISRSSGNSTLDGLALSAVRRSSPFPRPPKGASAWQLWFTYPVTFR